MMHPDTELRFISPEVGYGVFAVKPIPRGTVTWILCNFDMVFTPGEVAALPAPYQPIMEKYAYTDAEGNQVLCWDHGRYVNHSCDPAILGVGRDFEVAVRDVAPGEEITCEYGGLNLTREMQCCCGVSTCRGVIGRGDVLLLWPELDKCIAQTLRYARQVPQPLLPFSRNAGQFWDWVDGRSAVPSHRAYHAKPPVQGR
jgi:hypothetical protein